MFYYKVFDLENNFLGMITSLNFRMIHPKNKRMLCCKEEEAQYLYLNDSFYRAGILNTELPGYEDIYPEVLIELASKEEFEKYRDELNKKNLE